MIDELRSLNEDQQRRLIQQIDPKRTATLTAYGSDLEGLLLDVLRERLSIPSRSSRHADLGEYLRKRMVEVVRDDFAIAGRTDLLTDMELAWMIVDYVVRAAAQFDKEVVPNDPIPTFFRTKSTTERLEWIEQSVNLASAVADAATEPDRDEDNPVSAEKVAQVLLHNTAAIGTASTLRSARTAATPALGVPATSALSAVGAALFMAGVGGVGFTLAQELTDRARRARRARRSRLVQTVIMLSVYVLAEVEEDPIIDHERILTAAQSGDD